MEWQKQRDCELLNSSACMPYISLYTVYFMTVAVEFVVCYYYFKQYV